MPPTDPKPLMTPGLLTLNSTIDGYTLLKELGRGGMGAVYLAEKHGRHYALKFNLASADPEAQLRFQREAEAVAQVDRHPLVVKVHHFGQLQRGSQRFHFLVFDYIDGDSLDKIIERGPVEEDQCLKWAEDIAEALAHIHSQGIIHRDLKPANIMIRASDRRALLADFGLAKIDNAQTLTKTGEIMGTPEFMAPEQFHGATPNAALDIWAFGVLVYELLTQHKPFQAETLVALAHKINHKEPDFSAFAPPHNSSNSASNWTPFIARTLNKNRDLRPTAEQCLEALKQLREAPTQPSQSHWRGRFGLVFLVLALLGFAVLGFVINAVQPTKSPPETASRQILQRWQRFLRPSSDTPYLWLAQSLLKIEDSQLEHSRQQFLKDCRRLEQHLGDAGARRPSKALRRMAHWAAVFDQALKQAQLSSDVAAQGEAISELKRAYRSGDGDRLKRSLHTDTPACQRLAAALYGQQAFNKRQFQDCMKAWRGLEGPWRALVESRFIVAEQEALLELLFDPEQRPRFLSELRATVKRQANQRQAEWWASWNERLATKYRQSLEVPAHERLAIVQLLNNIKGQLSDLRVPETLLPERLEHLKRVQATGHEEDLMLAQLRVAELDPEHSAIASFKVSELRSALVISSSKAQLKRRMELIYKASQYGHLLTINHEAYQILRNNKFIEEMCVRWPNEPCNDYWRGIIPLNTKAYSDKDAIAKLQVQVRMLRSALRRHQRMTQSMRAHTYKRLSECWRSLLSYGRTEAREQALEGLLPKLIELEACHPAPELMIYEQARVRWRLQHKMSMALLDRARAQLEQRRQLSTQKQLHKGRPAIEPYFGVHKSDYTSYLLLIECERRDIYEGQRNFEEALRINEEMLDAEWSAPLAHKSAFYLYKLDRKTAARNTLKRLLERHPRAKDNKDVQSLKSTLQKDGLW